MNEDRSRTRFNVGEVVHHRKYDYRGVIVDVDAVFNGSPEWYEQMAVSRPPKDRPWYHVLVDGAEHSTYVAEQHLETDTSGGQVAHPALGRFFDRFSEGRYYRSGPMH